MRKEQLSKKTDNLKLFYQCHILGNEWLKRNAISMFVTVSRAFHLREQVGSRYLESQHLSFTLAYHNKGSHHVRLQEVNSLSLCSPRKHMGEWWYSSISSIEEIDRNIWRGKIKKKITGRYSLSSHRGENKDHIFWVVIPHDLGNRFLQTWYISTKIPGITLQKMIDLSWRFDSKACAYVMETQCIKNNLSNESFQTL